MESFSNSFHVLGVDTGHRDATIIGQINVMLISHYLDLRIKHNYYIIP